MVFGDPINIATATMEDIYDRLCWLYATVSSTLVCDGIGNTYALSDRTKLSRAQIPYPEQFVDKYDYEQNSFLRGLQTKDILCTKSDWISRGRVPLKMADHYDGEWHEMFVSIEGLPIQTPTIKAMTNIRRVQGFPTYLLDVSNNMTGRIMERAFEPVAPCMKFNDLK